METSKALATIHDLDIGTVYIMGGSFILGSLFTLLLLVLLDFMQRNREKRRNPDSRGPNA